jgi:peptide/nickel transport system substrate-binding protein
LLEDEKMKKRLLYFIASLMVVAVVLSAAACTNSKTQSTAGQAEKVLRIDEENLGYPSVYTVSSRGRGYLLMSFIFDTLTWKDENGIIPLLAEKWDVSADQKVWTFHLVKNAKFTDGKPLTSTDVKFSFDYLKAHPHPWVYLNMIDEVKAVDDYTVEIALKQVYAPFINDVAGNVPIMPKHIWENVKEPEKFNTPEAVIGSGPLKLAKYDKDGGSYIYEANKDYFYGKPVIDKLILNSNQNSLQALENGELDAALRLKYGEALKLKEGGKFRVIEGPGLWVARVYFNFDIPEFNLREFRQALYYALNRQEIVDKATRNSTLIGNPGHIHPDSEWYFKDVKQYEFDPEKAKQLLEDAGIRDANADGVREYNGKPLEYEFLVTDDKVNEAEMTKNYLAAIGIKINVKAMDQTSVDSLIKEGKFQLVLSGHGSFGGDPVLLARFASKKVTVGSTPTVTAQGGQNWSNESFDRLFAEQLAQTDKTKRYEQVAELQKIIAEELPTLTLYYKKIILAYNQNKFDGWFFTKDGVAIAVPTVENKLVFIRGQWK